MDKENILKDIKKEAAVCNRCSLCKSRKNVVFGEGNVEASIMFIGEAPGQEEDLQGLPFVGRAGKLLDKILAAAEIPKQEVYITNIIKCRPPENRNPNPDEVENCLDWLEAQIALVHPKIIVLLGRIAARYLLSTDQPISRIRGKWVKKEGILYMPTYHPAALLRNENLKRPVWEDFKKIREVYKEL